MKNLIVIAALFLASFSAHADEVKGKALFIKSDDIGLGIRIQGAAAKAMYDSLKVQPQSGMKAGKNILCTESTCDILFTDDVGTARNWQQ